MYNNLFNKLYSVIKGKNHYFFLSFLYYIVINLIKPIKQKLYFYLNNSENNKELKKIEESLTKIINYKLYESQHFYENINNPKISVVVTEYNGEGYLRRTLFSIENQDFKDIEIIMIDDCSKDNSVKLIKQLMKRDKRIKLYQNEFNRGALFTKANGILKSKAKYVMLIDEDDMYVQENALSTIYNEAEKYNLDLLSFGLLIKFVETSEEKFYKILNTPILFQPEISKNMYNYTEKKEIIRTGGLLMNYLFRKELGIKSVNQIDEKYLNAGISFHDDLFLFFQIIRNAKSFKRIKNIFYFILKENQILDKYKLFRLKEKRKDGYNRICFSFISYIEFLLAHTKNTILDKKIASSELKTWYLNHKCKLNNYTRNESNKVLKLFLTNKYIENETKLEIQEFLNSTKDWKL